jgi:hypothetical protein
MRPCLTYRSRLSCVPKCFSRSRSAGSFVPSPASAVAEVVMKSISYLSMAYQPDHSARAEPTQWKGRSGAVKVTRIARFTRDIFVRDPQDSGGTDTAKSRLRCSQFGVTNSLALEHWRRNDSTGVERFTKLKSTAAAVLHRHPCDADKNERKAKVSHRLTLAFFFAARHIPRQVRNQVTN